MNGLHIYPDVDPKSTRVAVGVSGGVDSSVAAYLLRERGFDVVGLYMNNWEEEDENGCCTSAEDWEDARAVCSGLGIPVYSVNFAAEYRDRVFDYFLREYKRGRTPNPDVLCNREIKFGPFSRYAASLGADYIATGHYCAVLRDGESTELHEAADQTKDQTYFLNQVSAKQLSNVIFPLAEINKTEVRQIADKLGLVNARKKDSTGICFIGERNFKSFLAKYLPAQPGDIIDINGRVVGRHDGLMYYTLGQRRGLGIGGIAGEAQSRWFVINKDLRNNKLIVKCGEGEELMSASLDTEDFNIIGNGFEQNEIRCKVKTRYRQPSQDATLEFTNGGTHIEFDTPQRAVTPGQYAVAYVGSRCVGGGVIK